MDSRLKLQREITAIDSSIESLDKYISRIQQLERAENLEQFVHIVDEFRTWCTENSRNKDKLRVREWSDFNSEHLSPIASAMDKYWQPKLEKVKQIRHHMQHAEGKDQVRMEKGKLGRKIAKKQQEKQMLIEKGKGKEVGHLDGEIKRLQAQMQTEVVVEKVRADRKAEIYDARDAERNRALEMGHYVDEPDAVMTVDLETLLRRGEDVLKTIKTLHTVDVQTRIQQAGIILQLEARKSELEEEKRELERQLKGALAKEKYEGYKDIQQKVALVRGTTLKAWVSENPSGRTLSLALPFPNPELARFVEAKLREHVLGGVFRQTKLGRGKSESTLFISSLDTELVDVLNKLLAPKKITIIEPHGVPFMVFPLNIGENLPIKMDDLIAKFDIVPKEPELPPEETEKKDKKEKKAAKAAPPAPSRPSPLERPSDFEIRGPKPSSTTQIAKDILARQEGKRGGGQEDKKGGVSMLFAKSDLKGLTQEVQSSVAKTDQPADVKEQKDKRKKKSSEHKSPSKKR